MSQTYSIAIRFTQYPGQYFYKCKKNRHFSVKKLDTSVTKPFSPPASTCREYIKKISLE